VFFFFINFQGLILSSVKIIWYEKFSSEVLLFKVAHAYSESFNSFKLLIPFPNLGVKRDLFIILDCKLSFLISCLLTLITSSLILFLEKQYSKLSLTAFDLSVINPDWTMDVVSKYGPRINKNIICFGLWNWLINKHASENKIKPKIIKNSSFKLKFSDPRIIKK